MGLKLGAKLPEFSISEKKVDSVFGIIGILGIMKNVEKRRTLKYERVDEALQVYRLAEGKRRKGKSSRMFDLFKRK
jgi:hypothetical protein